MDALRQLAVREGIPTSEKEIYWFHRYVYKSVRRHGRLNKLEAMIRFKVGSGDIFADMPAGLKMFARGKLEVIPHRVKGRGEVGRIFKHYDERRGTFHSNE
jgi:hypothetical protein